MRDTELEWGDPFLWKLLSSSDRPVSQNERGNHGAASPPLEDVFRLEAGYSLQVSHPCSVFPSNVHPPTLPCSSLLLYMIPAMGQGAPRGGRRYIYTLRQEKGQAGWMWQANRRWWSGGLGMNHRRIGAWQWMNNPPWLPKPHYFPPSPVGPEIHVCACCQFIRGRMSFLF